MSNLPSAETSTGLPLWPVENLALRQLTGLRRGTVGKIHDGLPPRRVELDYWAFTGWMTLGALILLIVLVIISSR